MILLSFSYCLNEPIVLQTHVCFSVPLSITGLWLWIIILITVKWHINRNVLIATNLWTLGHWNTQIWWIKTWPDQKDLSTIINISTAGSTEWTHTPPPALCQHNKKCFNPSMEKREINCGRKTRYLNMLCLIGAQMGFRRNKIWRC